MTITLSLDPETEQALRALAKAQGVPLEDYARQVLARDAKAPAPESEPQARNLFELLGPVRGLLTDNEADELFRRDRSPDRSVTLG